MFQMHSFFKKGLFFVFHITRWDLSDVMGPIFSNIFVKKMVMIHFGFIMVTQTPEYYLTYIKKYIQIWARTTYKSYIKTFVCEQ